MISNKPRNVAGQVNGQSLPRRMTLADFDGESMAVVLRKKRQEIVVRGTAAYIRDDTVGNALRIQLDDDPEGHSALLLSEDEWSGRIIPDFHHGCRYCVVFD
jgi:hypothetical protein